MTITLNRRQFLATTATAAAMGGIAPLAARPARAQTPTRLVIGRRPIEVHGRTAEVFGIRQPDGTHGLFLDPGQRFLVDVENRSGEDTIIHWHGMTPPWEQDGVDGEHHPAIADGDSQGYDFAPRPGTHWMHSHHGLQEQRLLAAPLIVRTAEDVRADMQEVTVLLHDFTFRDPAELLATLADGPGHGGMSSMPAGHGGHGMDHGMGHGGHDTAMDLNDVDYDAYLANDRTLDDPQVVAVERRGRVRLRLINGATSTAFWIDLGALDGTVVAADGNPVRPVAGRRFGMTMGQRLDIVVDLPAGGGAFPVLAQREGDRRRTGIILATPGAAVARIGDAGTAAAPVDLSLEARLTAVEPLPARPADTLQRIALTGGMMPYAWSIDGRRYPGHRPLPAVRGERIVIELANHTAMAHPMHLHGHHFQVIRLNGQRIDGAVRDTVLVPAMGSVAIALDADNAGRWPLHCHNLLHMATGMMTEVVYRDFA